MRDFPRYPEPPDPDDDVPDDEPALRMVYDRAPSAYPIWDAVRPWASAVVAVVITLAIVAAGVVVVAWVIAAARWATP